MINRKARPPSQETRCKEQSKFSIFWKLTEHDTGYIPFQPLHERKLRVKRDDDTRSYAALH